MKQNKKNHLSSIGKAPPPPPPHHPPKMLPTSSHVEAVKDCLLFKRASLIVKYLMCCTPFPPLINPQTYQRKTLRAQLKTSLFCLWHTARAKPSNSVFPRVNIWPAMGSVCSYPTHHTRIFFASIFIYSCKFVSLLPADLSCCFVFLISLRCVLYRIEKKRRRILICPVIFF